MCGISILLSKEEDNILLDIYDCLLQLQNRGYDSAGIGYINEGNTLSILKSVTNYNLDSMKDLKNKVLEINDKSKVAIAHTRWATHGGISEKNCHPHYSTNMDIALVHNGIIENFMELKTFLLEKGLKFNSETDSEVVVKLVEYYLWNLGHSIEISIKLAILRLKGTYGLGILYVPNKSIFLVKKGSPLIIGENNKYIIACSEESGLNNLVNNYIKIIDDQIYKLTSKGILLLKENEICKKIIYKDYITYQSQNECNSLMGYKYWTEKEIFEQSQSLLNVTNHGARIKNNIVTLGGLCKYRDTLRNVENIVLLGCGTSLYASQIAKNYLKEILDVNSIQVIDGAEFVEKDLPKGKTIVILTSQSGETRDLYKNISICKKNNCLMIGIINVVNSLIALEVDAGIYLNAGKEVGVASTKAFTSMLVAHSLLAMFIYQENVGINYPKIENKINSLRNLPNLVEKMLLPEKLENIKNIAQIILDKLKINNTNSLFILGKNNMFPLANEGALKIKEISYIHAEGFSGGALKHGPLALIENNIVCILLIDKINKDEMLNCLHEIRARNGFCIVITDIENIEIEKNKDILIFKTETNEYVEILFILFFQYLAFELSLLKGINPDKPRNLAKVVTVQ
jgi:glucosamine--fructose-6-phosphate aminotransferase (isomerizing)